MAPVLLALGSGRFQAATGDPFAGSLRQGDKCIRLRIADRVAGASIRQSFAIVFAGFGDPITFFDVLPVGGKCRSGVQYSQGDYGSYSGLNDGIDVFHDELSGINNQCVRFAIDA